MTYAENNKTFSLGLWEKLLLAILAALVGTIGFIGHNFSQRFDKQEQTTQHTVDAVQSLAIQIAVTNAQMVTLGAQLADVPNMARQLAELKVQVAENARRIENIEQMRRLK